MAQGAISRFLVKLFGSRNQRLIKGYMRIALEAAEFEEEVKALDDNALMAKTAEFKDRLAQGQNPDQLLSEAFAVVREAARRTSKIHFLAKSCCPNRACNAPGNCVNSKLRPEVSTNLNKKGSS